MFSWPLRIASWIIGVFALLALVTSAGIVVYTAAFQAFMNSLRDIVGLDILLKPLTQNIVLPTLDFIRSFGFHIPPLQDHWEQVFVLTWLMSASVARNLYTTMSVLFTTQAILLGFIFTLPFCIAAGTINTDSVGIIVLPLISIFFFSFAMHSIIKYDWPAFFEKYVKTELKEGRLKRSDIPQFVENAYANKFSSIENAFVSSLVVIFIVGVTVISALYFQIQIYTNDMRIWLSLIVALFGVVTLSRGLILGGNQYRMISKGGSFWERLNRPDAAIGLDITAVMLLAFGLATFFVDPPMF